MPRIGESVNDLRIGILHSNSNIVSYYFRDLYINKERTTKKSTLTIFARLKRFTILFLSLLFFLLEIIRKDGDLTNSVVKFNKDHIRILAMKEPENMNDHVYNNESRKKYDENFKYKKKRLKESIFNKWEGAMSHASIRSSIRGRKWENEKFMQLYNTITKDIEDFHNKTVEEHQKLKEKCPDDKEYSAFFKMKKKELSTLCAYRRSYITDYIKRCKAEWHNLE